MWVSCYEHKPNDWEVLLRDTVFEIAFLHLNPAEANALTQILRNTSEMRVTAYLRGGSDIARANEPLLIDQEVPCL